MYDTGKEIRICVGLIGAGFRARDLIKESPADLKLVAGVDCDLRCGTLLKLDMPEDKGPRMGGLFVGEQGKIEIK